MEGRWLGAPPAHFQASYLERDLEARDDLERIEVETADFVDIALEGATNQGPRPTVPEFQSVFDKLTELKLKQAKESAKQSNSRGRGGNPRGKRGGR